MPKPSSPKKSTKSAVAPASAHTTPHPKDACRVALIGFGIVGRAVAKILCETVLGANGDGSLRLTHICNRNVERKKQPWVPSDVIWTDDFHAVLNSDADVIIELIGGLSPSGEIVRGALQAGKSVITANKQLIARHGPELLQLASSKGVSLEFGASVAGGVPVLPALRTGLCGDRLHGIAGILNGTCNYILSRIEGARIPFSEALEEAQARGFAEADASEDLDGGDARAKLAILALAGLHAHVAPESIRARSIRTVEAVDFDYASELGCTIRQISRADLKLDTQAGTAPPGFAPAGQPRRLSPHDLRRETLFAEVGPSLVPVSSPFGRVQSNQNLVLTSGKYGGDMAFLGAGAGGDPTAVAVISDLKLVAQSLGRGNDRKRRGEVAAAALLSPETSCDFETPWYLRFLVRDRPGIVARLAQILSAHQLNIDSVLQNPGFDKAALPFVITLEPCRDSQLRPALEEMAALDFTIRPCLWLPILRQEQDLRLRAAQS
ncbi:MAG: homoserine dehydrogenase [Candidatus Sulfotelmatobacter sp.]